MGALREDLVGACIRYLFRVHLLPRGRCLKTWSVRVCGIFFVFNYFPGGSAWRPGRCEGVGSFSCSFTFWGAGGMKTWSLRGCWIFFLLNYSPGEGGLKTWSVRGCGMFFLLNCFPRGGQLWLHCRCEGSVSFSC
jgi:hypothetical protein